MRGGVCPQRRRGGQMGGWGAEATTRAGTYCGCFLPDLTGLAGRSSIADPPQPYIMRDPVWGKAGA